MNDSFSKALRKEFPQLTARRVVQLSNWIENMGRKCFYSRLENADPVELIACIHICRELMFENEASYRKIIKSLSAARKRRLYPGSFEASSPTPAPPGASLVEPV